MKIENFSLRFAFNTLLKFLYYQVIRCPSWVKHLNTQEVIYQTVLPVTEWVTVLLFYCITLS